ncbi:MAG: C-terminal binding protein [Chitinivibrionales bacterium]|nr:C-terminal binding protein [Chitinivibrionales bacterium]
MSKYKVLVTDHVFDRFDTEREVLARVDAELIVHQFRTIDELLPHVGDIHGLLNCYLGPIDNNVFDAAPNLKIVSRYGIGVDTINITDAARHGVIVSNIPDHAINEVADHAVALFLNLARKISTADRRVKNGVWSLSYVKPLHAIRGMTAGFIGFGKIGRAAAERLKAFGVRVVFHTPTWKGLVDGFSQVAFDELLAASDAVFIQCPSTEQTYHLINRATIEKMKKKPLLINTARGAIVDADALVWGLSTGNVSGAACDVLEDIDSVVTTDHPLKKAENVILTPHSAFYSEESVEDLKYRAAENVARVLVGKEPLFRVGGNGRG